MKLILCGGTRIVMLCGDKAYKLARFRPLRLFCRMLLFPFQTRKKQKQFYERYGRFPMSFWHYITVGFTINRTEYEYWQHTHDTRVMPAVGKFMGYFIIVQMRGERISAAEFRMNDLFGDLSRQTYFDLQCDKPHQFAKREGKVLLIDYGDRYTSAALATSLK